jgi:hypothetical protein
MGAITLFLLPQPGLKLLLGIETTESGILLLTRHWGALLAYSAFTGLLMINLLPYPGTKINLSSNLILLASS